jgi:hypothetical protein
VRSGDDSVWVALVGREEEEGTRSGAGDAEAVVHCAYALEAPFRHGRNQLESLLRADACGEHDTVAPTHCHATLLAAHGHVHNARAVQRDRVHVRSFVRLPQAQCAVQ